MDLFRSGKYENQGNYKSFMPSFINRSWQVTDMELQYLLSQADRELGRLDMFSEYIPNIDLFIGMHIVKEATQSSKIEGTQTNIEEALLDREDVDLEKRGDWEEVQNYIKALNHAVVRLKDLPFSSRLIKESHKILLQGVRGKHKQPGEFRRSQNWIGGATISDAIFIPPHQGSIDTYMGDLEKFVHTESYFPDLLKVALMHYQFETIHPFLDGNGRVGRLMITLYLVEKEILKEPILYLSDFFEKNRMLYYDNLNAVRQKNDLKQWFKFFLVGIIETAKNGVETFDKILKLKVETEKQILTLGNRARNAQLVLNRLYQRPIVDVNIVKDVTGYSVPSANKLLGDLEDLGILKEITGARRGRIYLFRKYADLF